MAVRFQYRGKKVKEATLGEVAEDLVVEGIGVGGGFIANASLGRVIQNFLKKDADVVNITDQVLAWSGNNLPKVAVWYLLRDYAKKEMVKVKPGEKAPLTTTFMSDVSKSAIGSVMFDTLIRLFNSGKNPAEVKIFGYQVLGDGSANRSANTDIQTQNSLQRLIQENSSLRSELNKALQRMANQAQVAQTMATNQPRIQAPPVVQQAPVHVYAQPVQPIVQPYVAPPQPIVQQVQANPRPIVTVQPIISERERKYGFMDEEGERRRKEFEAMPTYDAPTAVKEREKKYGFAGEVAPEERIAAMFGMI